jgi:chloramphenicol O-acetyltransferase type B
MNIIVDGLKRYVRVAKGILRLLVMENGRLKALARYQNTTFFDGAAAHDSTLGEKTVLHCNVKVVNSRVGRYTYFADRTIVVNAIIGSFCSIAQDVRIGLGKHPSSVFVSTHPAFFSLNNGGCLASFVKENKFQEFEQVTIGNDVWIGSGVMVSDGVTIGDGAIIAAGAIVVKNVEPYSIVGGVPAKHIKYRFMQPEIARLLRLRWWDKDITWIQANSEDFVHISGFLQSHSE